MAAEPVAKLLRENADLGPLNERLESIQRLQRRYRTLAPDQLAKASRVCAIEGTTVVICATSGTVAAALKQIAPRLLAGLRPGNARNSLKHDEKAEITAIRIEVQVESPPVRRRVAARDPIPTERLATIAEGLADSPLKATLAQMGKRKK